MIDRDSKFPPLNDRELRLLFDATQQAAPEIHAEFLERLQNQALGAVPRKEQLEIASERLLSVWRLSDALTQRPGWLTGAGLAMAAACGMFFGLNPPEAVLDVTTAYFQTESLSGFIGLSDEMGLYSGNT